ncbi:MAG: hypothetical protein HQ581_24030 [Planctomycetes bacterium]|nr:hypothetical protein [Planctomycetota bacterium]
MRLGELGSGVSWPKLPQPGNPALREDQVVVRAYEGSFIENNVRYVVPEKFSQVETSGLTATVPTDQPSVELNFDL